MSHLLQQFVWIALLQGKPQDLPSGQPPMVVAMLINVLTYILAVTSTRTIPNSLLLAISDLAVSGLCLFLALSVINKPARFHQAFTALCGATAVLNLAATPVFWLSALSETPSVLLNIAVIFWGLAIISHVLRHTLEVSPLLSVGLALAFYMIVLQLLAAVGIIGEAPDIEQQLSIYQYLSADWLSKA